MGQYVPLVMVRVGMIIVTNMENQYLAVLVMERDVQIDSH